MRSRILDALARIPPVLRSVLALLAFGGVAVWLTVTTWHEIKATRLDQGLLTDFRDAVYYPLAALRDGINPYDVDEYYRHYPVGQEFPLYTPIHLIAHSPLLFFSFPTARGVAFGWNLALVPVYAATLLRLLGRRLALADVFGVATLLLLSDPGRFDLRTGQPTLMIVIALVLVLRTASGDPALDADRPSPVLRAGAGIAALVVVWSKPTFAIPLVVLSVVRHRARIAAWGTAAAALLSAAVLPWLVGAAGGFGPLVTSLRESADITARSPQSKLGSGLRIDAANTLARITTWRPPEIVAALVGLALLTAGAVLVHRLRRGDPAGDREEISLTLVCVLILTSMYHVPYDYLLLAVPVALLLRRRPSTPVTWPRRVRTAVLVLLLVVMVDPLGWSPVNAVLGKSGFEWLFGATMMGTYVLTALGLTAWAAVHHLRASAEVPAGAPVS